MGYVALDRIPVAELYKKAGASRTALRFLGGRNTSALYAIRRLEAMKFWGIPESEGDTYRLKGGNQELPNAFARHLGNRVKLGQPVRSVSRDEQGVTVTCKACDYDKPRKMKADYLVNCITLPVFRRISVTPALSADKQYVVDV